MYSAKKPPHVLSKFAMDKLVMQEVSYHILAGLLGRLHKKEAPWPALTFSIELYEIRNFKQMNVKVEEINLYDLHCFVKVTT